MYGVTAFFFFLVGGFEALLIRAQLARPERQRAVGAAPTTRCSPCTARPWSSWSSCRWRRPSPTTCMPLQIGARDVAFPRLNAFSFWCFLAGGIFLNTSWFLGGAPDGGWFATPPTPARSSRPTPRHRLLGPRPADHRHRLAGRRHQPDRHRAQHARARHDADEDAGLHLDDAGGAVPAAVRHPGHHRGAVPADASTGCSAPSSSTWSRAPTRCCGSTCSGSSGTRRCTS